MLKSQLVRLQHQDLKWFSGIQANDVIKRTEEFPFHSFTTDFLLQTHHFLIKTHRQRARNPVPQGGTTPPPRLSTAVANLC